ncbi:hypothetical protein [Catellatospora tritici]|uniref:hypothetical protein n=1 Tax=Catellatospora tritici TaxID=2851566 RepID=UPI001C2D93D7|nr:hypothetical protein [Catellatospora tritici]MBV1848803.1 hypothetical protein [Catellatospora tritici]
MSDVLATATTVVSLLLAVIALIASARDRAPDQVQFAGTVVVNVVAVLLLAAAVVTWVGGTGPREVATFVGYGLTLALLPAGAWIVGKMEPTRFGSLIVGVAALIMPVLVLRMGQVWGA